MSKAKDASSRQRQQEGMQLKSSSANIDSKHSADKY